MRRFWRRTLTACTVGIVIGAAGCDNGPSAVQTRDRTGEAEAALAAPAAAGPSAPRPAERPEVWTSSRRYTAEENVARLYARNGAAFGARSAEDYVARAHAFIAAPPRGAETVRRGNGDTLYYDAASNTFLVANRDGVPRTMFKPDDGPAYWAAQKAQAANGAAAGQG